MAKTDVKDINEMFENFLGELEEAEKKVSNTIEATKEEAGRLVAEAAADAKALERVAQEALEEAKKTVDERAKLIVEDMRAQYEQEIKEVLEEARKTFDANFEKAVEVLLNSLLG